MSTCRDRKKIRLGSEKRLKQRAADTTAGISTQQVVS